MAKVKTDRELINSCTHLWLSNKPKAKRECDSDGNTEDLFDLLKTAKGYDKFIEGLRCYDCKRDILCELDEAMISLQLSRASTSANHWTETEKLQKKVERLEQDLIDLGAREGC